MVPKAFHTVLLMTTTTMLALHLEYSSAFTVQLPIVEYSHSFPLKAQRGPALTALGSTSDDGVEGNGHVAPKLKKKKFVINPNLVAQISSDGILADRLKNRPSPPQSSRLGVASKRKNKPDTRNSIPTSREERQRTDNGAIDSRLQTRIANPEMEDVQVVQAARGNKAVTIVRGMISPMDDRKNLLKDMKRSLGTGGTLVDGVLEIQGDWADKVVDILLKKGYKKARKIGK